ncbi:MAG: helix-turn-helix domain-containing protein [Planctomycetes bacterium]|nr:helix-turn-helix domain-containing protein [Planctomycetota bacterium]
MTDAQRERLAAYLDKAPPVSEQMRLAIDASPESRYAICKGTGIDQGQFSKFMAGKLGLSLNALDALCAYLGLELRAVRRRKGG